MQAQTLPSDFDTTPLQFEAFGRMMAEKAKQKEKQEKQD